MRFWRPASRHAWAAGLLLALLVALPPALPAQDGSLRPLTVEDLFRMEQLGQIGAPVAIAPDGEWVAYVLVRPKETAGQHDQPYLSGNDYADIWIAPAAGGAPRRITDGLEDGTGSWGPMWSPDGRYLTMFSTSDENIRLHVWERGTDRPRPVVDAGAESWLGGPIWVSETEIVFPALAEGETASSMSILQETPRIAGAGWAKAGGGREVTASVLESGVPVDLGARPHGRLLLHDVRAGTTRVLYDGDVRNLAGAPEGGMVAGFITTGAYEPRSGRPLAHQAYPGEYEIRVFDRKGAVAAQPLTGVQGAVPGSVRWAPDGRRFAFATRVDADTGAVTGVMAFTPSRGSLVEYDLGGLDPRMPAAGWLPPPEFRWASGDRLLVRARQAGEERADWWLVGRSGPVRNVTAAMESPPQEIHRVAGGAGWVGISEGDVWRIAEAGTAVNLTAGLESRITGFGWVDEKAAAGAGLREVVVESRESREVSALYRVRLSGEGLVEAVRKPTPAAGLAAFSREGGLAVFTASDRSGTYLWVARDGAEARLVLETNTFLREVADAEARTIEYRGLDGDTLTAWVLLPIGYQEGQRYPVVTWVYAGSMANPAAPTILANLNISHPLNLQLLTARGYAVLLPSMPLETPGTASDPYLDLPKGVLPAVDRLIDLGIADPDRLAVMGQSYGGYSTYGLITLTDRFRAAVSLAGVSNLVSLYGQFDARRRYGAYPHENLFSMSISETGQLRLGSPPWRDLQRYIRNSPITYVERVETPLLILQGDLDYVAMQQGEEFFQALYRQGKRARFVRYWGEGHVLSSPANIVDQWDQIFSWLAEHLGAPGPRRRASP